MLAHTVKHADRTLTEGLCVLAAAFSLLCMLLHVVTISSATQICARWVLFGTAGEQGSCDAHGGAAQALQHALFGAARFGALGDLLLAHALALRPGQLLRTLHEEGGEGPLEVRLLQAWVFYRVQGFQG